MSDKIVSITSTPSVLGLGLVGDYGTVLRGKDLADWFVNADENEQQIQ
jgi:hypothetical protein